MPTDAEAFAALTSNQKDVVNAIRKGLKYAPLNSDGATLASTLADADHDAEEPAAKKKKTSKYDPDKDVFSHLVDTGRFFARAVHPFDNMTKMAFHGAASRWSPQSLDRIVPNTTADQNRHKRLVDDFDVWFVHTVGFNSTYELEAILKFLFLHQNKVWKALFATLQNAAKSARQSDTHDLKFAFHYLFPNPTTDELYPKLPTTGESKSGRGVAHPVTRAFLLSCRQRQQLRTLTFTKEDENDELSEEGKLILQQLLSGALRFTNDEWPSCFYRDYTLFDSQKTSLGLFHGYFPIRVLRDIWVGSAAAMNGLDSTAGIPSQCTARAHRVFKVTPRMLGYALCQARTFLQADSWDSKVGGYDYETLFNKVVALFSSTNPRAVQWATETLEELTKAVFNANELATVDDTAGAPVDATDALFAERLPHHAHLFLALLSRMARVISLEHLTPSPRFISAPTHESDDLPLAMVHQILILRRFPLPGSPHSHPSARHSRITHPLA
ncbi:hypothetical protein C8F01DRAFT_1258084 [Mycena amicta]|nr:hypothetical protein C8F01DRAFT_1258084 [Mycena amicta]